jgi:hypothetical protein
VTIQNAFLVQEIYYFLKDNVLLILVRMDIMKVEAHVNNVMQIAIYVQYLRLNVLVVFNQSKKIKKNIILF